MYECILEKERNVGHKPNEFSSDLHYEYIGIEKFPVLKNPRSLGIEIVCGVC